MAIFKYVISIINKIIERYKKSNGKYLLEVACWTGHHLQYFRQNFSCTGIDINQGILNIAKNKTKNATFRKADMINFNLNKEFDVILSELRENIEKFCKTFENRRCCDNRAMVYKICLQIWLSPHDDL